MVSESNSHKRAKAKAAGRGGKQEAPLSRGRRLDAETARKATEVERSGDPKALERAARRLRASGKSQRVLQVPDSHLGKAAEAMGRVSVSGTVKNMSGTRRRSIRKSK